VEVLIGLSLVLAGVVGGAGLIVVYRRRQAARARLRSDELHALDQRIASRIAGLREGGNAAAAPPPRSDDELADLATPLPALLPLESGSSLLSRLGLRRPSRDVDPAERSTALRDTGVVLGVALVLLLIASQFLPASTPPPNSTATPTETLVAVLPTGTPNLLRPTAAPTATPAETPTSTPDITFEPTPTPVPTAAPTPYQPPSGGGGGGGGGLPPPTTAPDTSPPSAVVLAGNTVSASQINLSWSAATDNVAVAGYRVYRLNSQIDTVTTRSYSSTGLKPNQLYTYYVRAFDTSSNLGPSSNVISLTTPKATATLTLSGLAATYDGSPHAVTVTTSPIGLTGVSVTYDGSPTAPTDAGSYAVVASLTNTEYTAANATGTLVIAKASQTITFNQPPTPVLLVDGSFSVSATASSNLTVSFDSDTPSVCTVSGTTVTPVATGTCTIRASQPGNTNYNAAPDVTRDVEVQ
jgi:hypothetical protein